MRIYIADDSEDIRNSLVKMISRFEGIEIVGVAENASEAVQEIDRLKPDLVILDLFMPGGGGVVTLKSIKRSQPSPFVIVYSNYSLPQYKKLCLALGAERFYDKTDEYRELIDTVKQYALVRFSKNYGGDE